MNDELRSDLQHCRDLLGQNDLEANNLSNQLDKFQKIFHCIYDSSSELLQIRKTTDVLIQTTGIDDTQYAKIQKIKYVVEKLQNQIVELENMILNHPERILGNIMSKNLEAFLTIEKLIKNN